jgi:hypothetical protein
MRATRLSFGLRELELSFGFAAGILFFDERLDECAKARGKHTTACARHIIEHYLETFLYSASGVWLQANPREI